MKKLLVTAVVLCFAISAVSYAEILKTKTNLRKEASKTSESIQLLEPGTELTMTGKSEKGWIEVATKEGQTGWIWSNNMTGKAKGWAKKANEKGKAKMTSETMEATKEMKKSETEAKEAEKSMKSVKENVNQETAKTKEAVKDVKSQVETQTSAPVEATGEKTEAPKQ